MQRLSNNERADLYNALQPEIKAWLKAYEEEHGDIDGLSQKQLKEMLYAIRTDLVIPPWHPVTAYVKDKAAVANIGFEDNEDNAWCARVKNIGCSKADIGKRNWVVIHLHVLKDGRLFHKHLSVEKLTKDTKFSDILVWDMHTEHRVGKNSTGFSVYLGTDALGCGIFVWLSVSKLNTLVATLELEGKEEGDLEVESNSKKGPRKVSGKSEAKDSQSIKPVGDFPEITDLDIEITKLAFEKLIVDGRKDGLERSSSRWSTIGANVVKALEVILHG